MNGTVRHCDEAPERRAGNDATAAREVLDARDGCELFTLRTLRTVHGHGIARETGAADELLFAVSGRGVLIAADGEHELEPQAGALVGAGESYELVNSASEDLLVVSVSVHEPAARPGAAAGATLSRLADAAAQAATGEREFRIVFDPDNGCPSVTQFVGYIPVGAAPAHYHHYEEVIYVLDGDGVMHMNDERAPLQAGSCIHLPAQRIHTLENSGPGVMRVLGVFRPAGSPAAAFYPDGTPAYTAVSPQASAVTT